MVEVVVALRHGIFAEAQCALALEDGQAECGLQQRCCHVVSGMTVPRPTSAATMPKALTMPEVMSTIGTPTR